MDAEMADMGGIKVTSVVGIEKRGKAKRGEKTLLDALCLAMEEAEKGVNI